MNISKAIGICYIDTALWGCEERCDAIEKIIVEGTKIFSTKLATNDYAVLDKNVLWQLEEKNLLVKAAKMVTQDMQQEQEKPKVTQGTWK